MGSRASLGEEGVLEKILDHSRNQTCQKRAAKLKAGVGVSFNEPNFKALINHKVKAKKLKVVTKAHRIEESCRCLNHISSNSLYI
jgi:S-adenosylmethionine:tRNA-ribosyltransferase-isomerase (queuine synthetase)